jgi:hypothetical protein
VVSHAPGLEIETREIELGDDGIARLKVKVKNRANKPLVAWSFLVGTANSVKGVIRQADPGYALTEPEQFISEMPLDEIPEGAAVTVAAAYQDGEIRGGARDAELLRDSVSKKRGWKRK